MASGMTIAQGNSSSVKLFDAPLYRGLLSVTPMPRPIDSRTVRFLASLVLGVVCGFGYAQAPAQHHGHPHKRIEREQVTDLEKQWEQAMLASDPAAMDRLLSDDYLGVTAAGDLVTKSQQLDRMKDRQVNISKLSTTETKIKLVGGRIAIVNALSHLEGVIDNKPINADFRLTRIYQRLSNGAWKITNFEATRVHPEI
jgi:ketosteroid isomerase-like protein